MSADAAPTVLEYFPAVHATQVAEDTAAPAVEYEPARQSEHAATPLSGLYLPCAHAWQGPALGPVKPALHAQALALLLPAGELAPVGQAWQVLSSVAPSDAEYLPDVHSLHASLPAPALNLPATHTSQVPPSGPDEPALHRHADNTELPEADSEFAGQLVHVASDVAACDPEYLPAPHSSQMLDPTTPLNVPAAQGLHVAPLAPLYPTAHAHALAALLPAGELELDGQFTQVLALMAPEEVEYFPLMHWVHAAAPGDGLYVPAAHA